MGFFDLFKKKKDNNEQVATTEAAQGVESAAAEQEQQAKQEQAQKEELSAGLQKTKEGFFSKLARAVAGRSTVDADVLDDLEDKIDNKTCGHTEYQLYEKYRHYRLYGRGLGDHHGEHLIGSNQKDCYQCAKRYDPAGKKAGSGRGKTALRYESQRSSDKRSEPPGLVHDSLRTVVHPLLYVLHHEICYKQERQQLE